ncbi:ATP-binding cassette domain-containing protein [bacterium]|nr:ATP-binding cassette domain-containing protein [bacterium]
MIRLENLVKDYGTVRAVDSINFEINEGEILGFLGPNGAGKSTTLKMITCYLNPTAGSISVENYNVAQHSEEIKAMIGYLPETNPLYLEMTVYDYLKYVANMRNIEGNEFEAAFKTTIKKCGLKEVVAKPIHTLSKGYKQRVGLAQAIIHNPKILILDEPTSGLDPNQIVEIRELIKELGKEKTVILSSHILQEVQALCDRIVIINKGKIVADGSQAKLTEDYSNKARLILQIDASKEDLSQISATIPSAKLVSFKPILNNFNEAIFEYTPTNDVRPDIFNYIKEKDWTLLEFHRDYISLEEVFRSLTLEGGNQ